MRTSSLTFRPAAKTATPRPGMRRPLEYPDPGGTIVVWRINRFGRSLIDVLHTINGLRDRHQCAIDLGRGDPLD
ncbi:recombinase family protein [Herbiconiux sp. P15]|uniref:recombinase family protein n=1 Tax=Herbiconiux liukaitaii TaxID=3342799 RepID=UPI0035BA44A7